MADTAFQTQYRQEFIAGFERRQSLLRDSVTSESIIKGNAAVFLVADSGSAAAVTRGVNGMIPARADVLTSNTATLVEWHDLVRKTDFNVFASQGDVRALMQKTTMAVINRKIDSDIITALGGTTVQLSATAATASLNMVLHAKAALGNSEVPFDGNICAVVSPAFEAYLLQTAEFSSADYVNRKPMSDGDTGWDDSVGYYNWLGVKWIVTNGVEGNGTAAEECFMYHKTAVGHAVDTGGMSCPVGYDEEQAYSWARCTANMGSKLLQTTGVVEMIHDGSAFATV